MNMNRSYRMVSNLVLALAGAFVFTGLASAQTTKGKFTLPFEARWGLATLPPGDYSFTLDKAQSFGALQLFRGTEHVAIIRSEGYKLKSSDHSALTVVRNSAGNTVRELSLPEIGEVLYYAPHKAARGSAAEEREIAQIPITPAGK